MVYSYLSYTSNVVNMPVSIYDLKYELPLYIGSLTTVWISDA